MTFLSTYRVSHKLQGGVVKRGEWSRGGVFKRGEWSRGGECSRGGAAGSVQVGGVVKKAEEWHQRRGGESICGGEVK